MIIELQQIHSEYRMHVKHELQSKRVKQFCTMQTFPDDIFCLPVENRVLLFG